MNKYASKSTKPLTSPKEQERLRAQIDSQLILKKLIGHVKGEIDMKTTQIKAAEVLLRKTVPDLAVLTIKGDEDNPFLLRDISDRPRDSSKWLETAKPIEGEIIKETIQ